MSSHKSYIFGPVPSRRLGKSLGVDIVPFKACTLDCVYCQIGRTPQTTTQRAVYAPIDAVIEELKQKIEQGVTADYITISGSGEPTLHLQLGELIDAIKNITDIPVALLTNGTMLHIPEVRKACAKADVIMPSLDAGNEVTFSRTNRPNENITFATLIDGLKALRSEYTGQIWLEVFLIKGYNTDLDQLFEIRKIIHDVRPDKIHLNTAVRPTAEPDIKKISKEELQDISLRLGGNCEVIADFASDKKSSHTAAPKEQDVYEMLKRRPCSLRDISTSLDIPELEAVKYLEHLTQKDLVKPQQRGDTTYYVAS